MLSFILLQCIHGEIKGFFIGLHLSGVYSIGNSQYKREDVNSSALTKEQAARKQTVYPNISSALPQVLAQAQNASTTNVSLTWQAWINDVVSSVIGTQVDRQTLYADAVQSGLFTTPNISPPLNSAALVAAGSNINQLIINAMNTYAQNQLGITSLTTNIPIPPSSQTQLSTMTNVFITQPLQNLTVQYQSTNDPLVQTVTPQNYYPGGNPIGQQPLTSPFMPPLTGQPFDAQQEQSNWTTVTANQSFKGFGPIAGLSAGYLKSLGGHAFAGAEAYAIQPFMTLSYTLNVPTLQRDYGTVSLKPGLSYGVAAIAGKELNWGWSLYTKMGVEFKSIKGTFTINNDSPTLTAQYNPQQLKASFKPIFAGGGLMMRLSGFFIRFEYLIVKNTKATLRDFSTLGDDGRRRGYIVSGTDHRVSIILMKTFGG